MLHSPAVSLLNLRSTSENKCCLIVTLNRRPLRYHLQMFFLSRISIKNHHKVSDKICMPINSLMLLSFIFLGRFSPLPLHERKKFEFSKIPTFPESETNPTGSTLNVPNSSWGHPSGSTSPSLSTPLSSPSLTPRSPLSPQYPNGGPSYFSESFESSGNSSRKQSDSSQSRHTVDSTNKTQNSSFTHQNGTDILYEWHNSRSQEESSQTEDDQSNMEDEDLSSVSCDSIEDKFHLPRGRRPPPMIVSQEDWPEFVAALSPKNSLKRLLERTMELDER